MGFVGITGMASAARSDSGWSGTVWCCQGSWWPRFPWHPFDLLGGRVIAVAGSSWDVGFLLRCDGFGGGRQGSLGLVSLMAVHVFFS